MAKDEGANAVAPKEQADQAAGEIRSFHELGRKVLDRAARDKIPKDRAARAVSVEEKVSYDRARKAHRFARVFDARSVERLEALCRAPGNAPLTVNHLRRVLKVEARVGRMRWLQLAAEEGWSADRLAREVRLADEGATGKGGPRFKGPKDLLDALDQVLRHSDEWLKRFDGVWGTDACWPPVLGFGEAEPTMLADRLKEVQGRLRRLGQATGSLIERLAKINRDVRRVAKDKESGRKPRR